jgi:hypothetical protein
MRQRPFRLLGHVDFSLLESLDQIVGHEIDQLDGIGTIENGRWPFLIVTCTRDAYGRSSMLLVRFWEAGGATASCADESPSARSPEGDRRHRSSRMATSWSRSVSKAFRSLG